MKFKKTCRALSILLAFAMLSGLCPLFSMGAEQEAVTILFEEESKRTENEKHYFCSDGSYIAVSYPRAVHYLDENGAYVDIDNSLSYNEETAAYENTGNPAFGVSLSDFDGLETVKVKGKDKGRDHLFHCAVDRRQRQECKASKEEYQRTQQQGKER